MTTDDFDHAPALVFRRATVVTVDDAGVITDGDVLVIGDRIAAVGTGLAVPEGTVEIDGSGGILMPGMIDTHRHMWQANLRGFGADWTLSEYFTFYYLQWGPHFRPRDIYAGNLLSGVESVDAGVTTTVDWSHGLQTVEHAEAAADALLAAGGRFVLACGNLLGGPWEWANDPAFRAFVARRTRADTDMLALQLAFDVTGDPAFPERAAFEAARELGLRVTTHAGVWQATNDVGIQQMWDAGFMDPTVTYVHCSTLSDDSYRKIAASGGTASVATESEMNAGQGYPPTHLLRRYGIPVSLSQDTSVWWSGDMFSAMRATLNADRARCHLEAHAEGRTVTVNEARAEDVVRWATLGGARAIGREADLGSIRPGKKADLVLVKNDRSPAMRPILHPYGHLVYQAGRGDVHTVLVDGRVVKHAHRLRGIDLGAVHDDVDRTVDFLRSTMGEQAWRDGMAPALPAGERIDNPYTYSAVDGRDAK
ncbi:amidohydrolase family protein [Dactylosporangium sp. NPDC005572]|uniref:amidohydrolase family protein n=1 Tax=Dactylosporangium sp. NPDC005572 TaxID=3156889 RepID=UPI0033B4EE4F